MFKWAIVCAALALIAALLGYGGLVPGVAALARVLFGFFLILALVFVVLAALGVGGDGKAIK